MESTTEIGFLKAETMRLQFNRYYKRREPNIPPFIILTINDAYFRSPNIESNLLHNLFPIYGNLALLTIPNPLMDG